MSFLDNHILCVKNGIARPWDENSREIEITIYDKKYYDNKELFDRPHYIKKESMKSKFQVYMSLIMIIIL